VDGSKTFSEMIGDALREMAVLVVVFAPLDRWVEKRPYDWHDVCRTAIISGVLFVLGALLEKVRNL
jgi:hypothetical protein